MRQSKSPLFFIAINILFNLYQVAAQEKRTVISFEYYTHDFGTIKEEGGLISYEFEFKNSGNVPLIIKNVQAGCGCTVPAWPKEQISPGNKGKILVEFNPVNKPGPFSKTLTVFSNSTNDATILTLVGKVVPKPKKPADDYPDVIGKLRMISRYMNFGDVTTEKPLKKEYFIYNQSDSIISIEKISYNTSFMKVAIEPLNIPPASKAKISVEYDAGKRNEYGYVHDRIELLTNDKMQEVKFLYVSSSISKYFDPILPEERNNVPKIRFDKTTHDFGSIKSGEKVSTTFNIRNDGKDNLIIYKIRPSCGCTVGDLEKKVLTPGESSKLIITFDTEGKEGVQEKHINIYCSDPNNFNMVITIKGKIQNK